MASRLTPVGSAAALALMLIGAAPSATAYLGATIYSIRPDGTGRTLVLRLDPPVYYIVQSPDGQKIAFSRSLHMGTLFVSDVSGKNPVQIHPSGYPLLSPDGAQVAVSTDKDLYVVNTDDTDPRFVAAGGSPSWSPDGRLLAYVVRRTGRNGSPWNSEIHIVSAQGGHDVTIARGLNPEWATRGNRIAYLALRRGYAVPCFVAADGLHRMCYRGFSVNGHVVWSPDGKRIAFRQGASQITVVTAQGRHIRRLPRMDLRIAHLAWSPDGRSLAYSKDGATTQIYIRPVNRTGGERRVTNETRDIWDVRWVRGRISYVMPGSVPLGR